MSLISIELGYTACLNDPILPSVAPVWFAVGIMSHFLTICQAV